MKATGKHRGQKDSFHQRPNTVDQHYHDFHISISIVAVYNTTTPGITERLVATVLCISGK